MNYLIICILSLIKCDELLKSKFFNNYRSAFDIYISEYLQEFYSLLLLKLGQFYKNLTASAMQIIS